MISKPRTALRVILMLALCLAFFSCTVFAASSFDYVLGDYDGGSGALLKVYPNDEDGTAEIAIIGVRSASPNSYDLVIPETITDGGNDYTVTYILADPNASNGCALTPDSIGALNSVTVPDTVTGIAGNLFRWNKTENGTMLDYLKISQSSVNLSLPDTESVLETIPGFISDYYDEDGCYYAGKTLVRVDPDFEGDVEVKEGTVSILASAFEGCTGIEKVTLPSSVEYLATRAFANSSVTEVNIPAGLTDHGEEIFSYTFYGCKDLKTVSFDEGCELYKIGFCAFLGCESLEGIDLSNVGGIEGLAFAGAFDGSAELNIRPEQLISSPGHFAAAGIKTLVFGENEDEDGSTIIYTESFRDCVDLTSVTLSSSVERLYAGAFEGCTSLEEDILAQEDCAVKNLDFRSLANTGMTEVTLPESLTSTSGAVFAYNPQLVTINIKTEELYATMFSLLNHMGDGGDSNYKTGTTTDSSSQYYCYQPEKNGHTFATTINIYCDNNILFREQPYLETVNFKYEVDTVGNLMFQFCPALSAVNFDYPEALETIGDYAFVFCPSLHSFPFEELTGLKSIGSKAFMLDSAFYTASAVAGFSDARKDYGLTGALDLSKCTSLETLGACCFYSQYHVTSVKLPASVTQLASNGSFLCHFLQMASLKSFEADCPASAMPAPLSNYLYCKPDNNYIYLDSPEYDGTFSVSVGNEVLETIIMPHAGNINAGPYFVTFTALKSVTLGETEQISTINFVNCVGLEEVHLPDATEIGSLAFFNTLNLKTVDAPKVETVGFQAFMGSGIEEISLPAAKTLGENVFMFCPELETVSLPSLETIEKNLSKDEEGNITADWGNKLFFHDYELKEIDLGEITEIPKYCFFNTGLEEIAIPAGVTVGDFAFSECPDLKTVVIEEGVTELGKFAFANCSKLEKVSLPSTLTTVNWAAFKIGYDSNTMASTSSEHLDIALPESLTLIEDDAFAGRQVDLLLQSEPEFEMVHPTDKQINMSTREDIVALKPVGEGSVIYYVDEGAKTCAENYRDQFTDEEGLPVKSCPEDLAMIIEGAPERVKAGEDLDLSEMIVTAAGIGLSEDEYELDYDKSDKTLGERDVNVTTLGTYAGRKDNTVKAMSIFAEEKSGEVFALLDDEALSSVFTVNVYDEYTVEFVPGEGAGEIEPQTVRNGDTAEEPEAPEREGFVFGGWFTDEACAEKYDFSAPVEGDLTLYAKWTEEGEEPAPLYTIKVSGGTADKDEAEEGETVTVTADSKSGYEFDKWTVVTGAAILESETSKETRFEMPAGDVELKAEFKKKSSSGSTGDSSPTYPIETAEAENGSAEVRSGASAGSKVTVTPKPDEGYETAGVTVKDGKGNEIKVTDNGDGTYSFIMPAGRVTVTPEFRQKTPGAHECPASTFSDVDLDAWYHESIDYAVLNGLMEGVGGGRFAPKATTTRAMIVTILWRLEGQPAAEGEMPFTDVPEGQWYSEPIKWAAETGVVEGYGNGLFGPTDHITREQFVTILWRYAQLKDKDVSVGEDTNILSYDDAFDISEWAMPAMQWAVGCGLMEGRSDTVLAPQGNASRVEAATFFMRFADMMK